jgi:hypothetical protein
MRKLKLNLNSVALVAVLTAFMGGSGCSLKSGNDSSPSLYVDLSSMKQSSPQLDLMTRGSNFIGLGAPPAAANGFSCYAINVTGPGIAETGKGNSNNTDPLIDFYKTLNTPNTYCAYRGAVTPPLFLDNTGTSSASIQVPPGDVRLVQIVGVNDPLVCGSGVVDDPAGSTSGSGPRFYEVGRAVLNGVFADRAVDVNLNWPTNAAAQAARAMDCGGACVLLDQFNAAAAATAGYGTFSGFAQLIPSNPGQYIRSVDVNLALTAADNVTVTIYQANHPSTTPGTGSATTYASTLALPAGTSGSVTFNMHTGNGYLQMLPGYDYWIVVNSPGATGNSTTWKYTAGTSVNTTAQYAGGWSPMSGNAGFDYRVNECAN